VYLDNKYLLKKVTTVDKKASASAEDCGAICSRIDDILNSIVFMSRAMMGAIKCAIGYNHYGYRHSVINKNLTMLKCFQCDKCKTWKYIIQCKAICYENEAFMISLRSKIEKEAATEEEEQSIDYIMSDIRNFLLGNEKEMITN